MEMELASTGDIIHELQRRQLRFVLVAMENTNSAREDMAYVAGQGDDCADVISLMRMGREALEEIEGKNSWGSWRDE